MNTPHLFCFGLGFTGLALGRRLLSEGWRVSGTCRTSSSANALTDEGIATYVFDGDGGIKDDTPLYEALGQASHILSTIPPSPSDGDPVLHIFKKHLKNLPLAEWIGYLSTTGVYGDTNGQEVDETAPTAPSGIRGERRVAAEQDWLSLHRDNGSPVHIFRLPGIYGPGRSVLDQVRGGKSRRIHKPGHAFNRIHVDDIVGALLASMAKPNSGAIYNVCDDEPAAPSDVTVFACELLDIELPPLVPFDEAKETMSDMALSFWQDNRRVSNARLRNELGVTLKYPNYREGLKAILAGEREG